MFLEAWSTFWQGTGTTWPVCWLNTTMCMPSGTLAPQKGPSLLSMQRQKTWRGPGSAMDRTGILGMAFRVEGRSSFSTLLSPKLSGFPWERSSLTEASRGGSGSAHRWSGRFGGTAERLHTHFDFHSLPDCNYQKWYYLLLDFLTFM